MLESSHSSATEGTGKKSPDITVVVEEISEEANAEILGRKRPEIFTSTWSEVAFVGSMLVALSMAVCVYYNYIFS